jgi:hypothetical protein
MGKSACDTNDRLAPQLPADTEDTADPGEPRGRPAASGLVHMPKPSRFEHANSADECRGARRAICEPGRPPAIMVYRRCRAEGGGVNATP